MWAKILKFFGKKVCDICGKIVEDTDEPVHYTRNGGWYIHPLHAITSKKGRKLIDNMNKLSKEEIEARVL